MLIKVTRGDIKRGKPNSPYACPVALAIMRAIRCKDGRPVSAGLGYIYNLANGKNVRTPPAVTAFIAQFDDGTEAQDLEPFDFELPDDLFEGAKP